MSKRNLSMSVAFFLTNPAEVAERGVEIAMAAGAYDGAMIETGIPLDGKTACVVLFKSEAQMLHGTVAVRAALGSKIGGYKRLPKETLAA